VLFELRVTWLLRSRQGRILGRVALQKRGCLNYDNYTTDITNYVREFVGSSLAIAAAIWDFASRIDR
jgi:hypothetical protein